MLGTETNVRLLRVLAERDHPYPLVELAREASLHLSGIGRALETLEDTGVVEYVGVGRRRLARLCAEHPLTAAIKALFAAERNRVESVVRSLKDAALNLRPPPAAVWLQGSYVTGSDAPGDSLEVGVLDERDDWHGTTTPFRAALGLIERDLDITIEVRRLTMADLAAAPRPERAALGQIVPLLGPPTLAILGVTASAAAKGRARTHAELDARALRLAGAIADLMKRDPRIAGRALAFVTHRLAIASPTERHDLREWEHVLRALSPHRLRKFLRDPGERATRLRQTLPFLSVLSPEDRDRLVHGDFVATRRKSAARKPASRSNLSTKRVRSTRKTSTSSRKTAYRTRNKP